MDRHPSSFVRTLAAVALLGAPVAAQQSPLLSVSGDEPGGQFGRALTLSTSWPAGLPAAFSIWHQFWVVDGTATAGLSASNAVRGTTP
jgi:hypothetical protein